MASVGPLTVEPSPDGPRPEGAENTPEAEPIPVQEVPTVTHGSGDARPGAEDGCQGAGSAETLQLQLFAVDLSDPPEDGGQPAEDPKMRFESELRRLANRLKIEALAALPGETRWVAVRRIDQLVATHTEAAVRVFRLAARLPWNRSAVGRFDVDDARRILDEEHVGGEALKELVGLAELIDFAASRGASLRPPALLLAGPPGVGKTTVAQAFAAALGRPLAKVKLAGSSAIDLGGSSEQYSDSSPGLIIRALDSLGVNDPVLLLDEIDKLATSTRNGRAEDVLLGLLDGADEGLFNAFLGLPFDLSGCVFLATANDTTRVSAPLLDRMRTIFVPAYSSEELLAIGHQRLLPRLCQELALDEHQLLIEDDALAMLIASMTTPGGVRPLEAALRMLLPAAMRRFDDGEDIVVIDAALVRRVLGTRSDGPTLRRIGGYL